MEQQAAALIIHDLKNSLGVLEGQLEALAASPDASGAHLAWHNCSALRERLVAFLTVYRAETQGLQAHCEPLSPQDFLEGVLGSTLHRRPGVVLELDTRSMPTLAFFDEHLVGLALDAALQNASRFARGRVRVSCQDREGGILFQVQDDGPGPAAASASDKPSTGLGMVLCQAVALAHRKGAQSGNCSLSASPEGGGVFALYLP